MHTHNIVSVRTSAPVYGLTLSPVNIVDTLSAYAIAVTSALYSQTPMTVTRFHSRMVAPAGIMSTSWVLRFTSLLKCHKGIYCKTYINIHNSNISGIH